MKIALLGKGKTGSKVVELASAKKDIELTIFDSSNSPTRENLAGHDVILSFFTGDVFLQYIEEISASGICVVSGSTGFDWTPERISLVENSNSPWIHSNNFSLGMNIVKQMITILSKADALFENSDFTIHEIHHTKKLDAPSGTAKAWQNWLGHDAEMTYERIGDVVGTHELTLKTDNEKIFLRHEALDRKIFAEGALWACEQVRDLKPGLHDFSTVAIKALTEA
jgi:4-hydroxy-tetrahydrodipicolinate reductase